MENLLNITEIGLFFGMIGTTIGGIVGANLKIKNNKIIGFVLEFSAGLMTAIICFDLIPEALNIAGIGTVLLGIFLGIAGMFFCSFIVNKKINRDKSNNMVREGIIIGIGLAIHNFPEGLAIGSGCEMSRKLGISLVIAIAIHDFPEGISVALPLKQGRNKFYKSNFIYYAFGDYDGYRCFLWGFYRRNIVVLDYNFFIFCSWNNVIYCFL